MRLEVMHIYWVHVIPYLISPHRRDLKFQEGGVVRNHLHRSALILNSGSFKSHFYFETQLPLVIGNELHS